MGVTTLEMEDPYWSDFKEQIEDSDVYESRTDALNRFVKAFVEEGTTENREVVESEIMRLRQDMEDKRERAERLLEESNELEKKVSDLESRLDDLEKKDEEERQDEKDGKKAYLEQLRQVNDGIEKERQRYEDRADKNIEKDDRALTEEDREDYIEENLERKASHILPDEFDSRDELREKIEELEEELN